MARKREQVSSVAIRIPESTGEQPPQSEPKLFIHEASRQALERKLSSAWKGRTVVLSITDNRLNMVTTREQNKVLFARVHHMFLEAPPDVVDAVVRYIVRDVDDEAGAVVDAYIAAKGHLKAKTGPHHSPYDAKGDYHDLIKIYNDLNRQYFDDSVHAIISWGRYAPRKKGQPRNTLNLGKYLQSDNLIRIHPVLDNAWVPRFFISDVIHHEMLHHVLAWDESDARRCIHPPEFLEREKQFKWHSRALEWEKKNLNRLLRWG